MATQTSLVAQQVRIRQWAEQIRNCQNRPKGMDVETWCTQNNLTKANYYYRLRRVRQICLDQMQDTETTAFVELPAPARLNMFPYSDNNDKQEKQIFEKMEKYMVNKNHKRNARSLSATFDEVLEVLKPEELLKHLEWFQNQIEFAIQIVEKYDDRKISRKKKVSTILEEL